MNKDNSEPLNQVNDSNEQLEHLAAEEGPKETFDIAFKHVKIRRHISTSFGKRNRLVIRGRYWKRLH